MLLEMDPAQVETVAEWLVDSGLSEVEALRDLAGRERVLVARRPGAVATQEEPNALESQSANRGNSQEGVP